MTKPRRHQWRQPAHLERPACRRARATPCTQPRAGVPDARARAPARHRVWAVPDAVHVDPVVCRRAETAWRSSGRAARAPAVHTVRAARPPVAVVPEAALPLRRAAVAGGQARHDLRKQLLLQRRAAGHDRVRECILGRLRDGAPAASIKGASAALAGAQCRAGCRLAPAKGPARCSRARMRACRQ